MSLNESQASASTDGVVLESVIHGEIIPCADYCAIAKCLSIGGVYEDLIAALYAEFEDNLVVQETSDGVWVHYYALRSSVEEGFGYSASEGRLFRGLNLSEGRYVLVDAEYYSTVVDSAQVTTRAQAAQYFRKRPFKKSKYVDDEASSSDTEGSDVSTPLPGSPSIGSCTPSSIGATPVLDLNKTPSEDVWDEGAAEAGLHTPVFQHVVLTTPGDVNMRESTPKCSSGCIGNPKDWDDMSDAFRGFFAHCGHSIGHGRSAVKWDPAV